MANDTIVYLDEDMLPVPKKKATIAKVRRLNGDIQFMQLPPKGELSSGPGLLLKAVRYAQGLLARRGVE